jgi:hypothetical protein
MQTGRVASIIDKTILTKSVNIYTVFGSMERLKEGKKVSGKNHFPLFGCLSEWKERLV